MMWGKYVLCNQVTLDFIPCPFTFWWHNLQHVHNIYVLWASSCFFVNLGHWKDINSNIIKNVLNIYCSKCFTLIILSLKTTLWSRYYYYPCTYRWGRCYDYPHYRWSSRGTERLIDLQSHSITEEWGQNWNSAFVASEPVHKHVYCEHYLQRSMLCLQRVFLRALVECC